MKHAKRKLLSLLLALAVMCSMVPAAMAVSTKYLAAGEEDTLFADEIYSTLSNSNLGSYGNIIANYTQWYSSSSAVSVSGIGLSATIKGVSAGTATVTAYIPSSSGYSSSISQSWNVTVYGSSTGGSASGYVATISPASLSLSANGTGSTGYVSVSVPSGYTLANISWSSNNPFVTVTPYTSDRSSVIVAASANATGYYATAIITATMDVYSGYTRIGSDSVFCSVTVGSGSNTGDLYMSSSSLQLQPNSTPGTLSVASSTYSSSSLSNVVWSSSNSAVAQVYSTSYPQAGYATGSSVYVYGISNGQATITATLYSGNQVLATASCPVTVGSGSNTSYDTGHFYISSSTLQLEPNGGYTVLTAIPYPSSGITSDNLNSLTWYSSNPSVASVYSYHSTTSGYATGSSVYVSGLSAGKATITAQLDSTRYATCEVTVGSDSASIDVLYSLTKGQSKTLAASDFTSFWNSAAGSRGALQYVVFGNATGSVGKLTYRTNNNQEAAVSSAIKFYVSPSSSQYGINSVTFTPNKSGSSYATGTLAVPFTAYGASSYYGTTTTSLSGTLYIAVTNGEVQDISYQATGSAITLNPTDFVNVYRQAVSVASTNPTVYIQFLDTPTFGDLYYNYNANRYSSGVKLTASNIGSMRFSSRTTDTYGIDDVTYVPSASNKLGDTVRYAAYSTASGGTLLYVGEITFDTKAAPAVKFYGAVNGTVQISSAEFTVSGSMTASEYIVFGTPSSGTLYKDYAGGKGTKVTGGDTFTLSSTGTYSVPSVNSLTFVPATGFSGVVEIPFTCANILGSQSSGTVKIYISKTFSDVAPTNWAYEYITQLTAEGIVNGMTETTFAPNQNLKYGEALKLIMEAAGYPKLEKTGTHWASGYLTRAYRDGLVSSSNINLESYIDRNTVASITAKALGMSKATSISAGIVGPSDSTDGYVYALYNAGILTGENRGGKNYYDGSSTLTRAQVCAIVCRISDYNK